jgi:hypothetical protein
VSQNLKDDIKSEMTKFCDLIRMHLFKEWFQEANYSLSVQAAVATTRIRFNEIDVDNQIKMQNHYIQLWLNDALTEDEYRRALNRAPMTNKEKGQTHSAIAFEREKEMFDMTASSQLDLAQYNAEASHSLESMTPGNKSKKAPVPGAQGAANLSANKARPRNQHKTNPGPTKAKSARANFYQMAVDRVSELSSTNTNIPWDEVAAEVLAELSSHKTINLSDNVSYTKEPCIDAFVSEIKTLMSLADGTEMLSVLVNDNLQRIEGNYGDEQQLQREESQPDLSDKDSSTGSSEDTTVGDGIRT